MALLLSPGAPAPPGVLRLKASPAVAPCVAAVRELYERSSGRSFVLEVGSLERAASAAGADVVVGVEGELTRILEGGISHPDLDVAVASIPWVLVGGGRDVRALDRPGGHVAVLGGLVGLEARRSLQHLPAERVRTLGPATTGPVRTAGGDLAVVPLSLAAPGEVAPLSLPPLEVRALGVRASRNLEAARGLLHFLSQGVGNTAFCDCGRGER